MTNPTHWSDALEQYWNDQLAGAVQINIPDQPLANVIRASQVHCFLAARNREQGRYVEPWVAAMAFGPIDLETPAVVRGMDMCGNADFAQRGLNCLLDKRFGEKGLRYVDAGYFTTGYTLSGTGVDLWVLGEHFARCNDRQWLKTVAPQLIKACKWITNRRASPKARTSTDVSCPSLG